MVARGDRRQHRPTMAHLATCRKGLRKPAITTWLVSVRPNSEYLSSASLIGRFWAENGLAGFAVTSMKVALRS